MRGRALPRAVAALVVVVVGAFTYPGTIVVSVVVRLAPALLPSAAAVSTGDREWLHVEHPSGQTPYIADQEGRMVLLHGAIPAGLIDFWSGSDPKVIDSPPYFPIDPAAYDGKCPSNSAVIASPPLCQADIEQMAALGFNSVRLPMSWSLLEPERGKFNELYLDRVAQVVAWARSARMYVILDMHQNAYSRYVGRTDPAPLVGGSPPYLRYYTGAPAWATLTDGLPSEWFLNGQREINPAVFEASTSFWYNRDGIQDEYIETIAHVMRRFKDDSTVAGISIFNEPWPGWNLSPGFEDLLLFPFYRRVIDAITGMRDGLPCPTHVFMPAPCGYPDLGVHDTRQLVFVDPGLLREVTDFPTHLGLSVTSYPNLVLGLHAYTHVFSIDHLLSPSTPPDKASYPWGGYDQSYFWAEREARALGAALFVSEFGNDPRNDSTELSSQLREQELHRTGFAFWTWMENCGDLPYGVFDGIKCDNSSSAQPSSGCLRQDRAGLLARVYPEASSDPNLTYSYDPSNGSFTLHATGHAGDAPTVIVVPGNVNGSITALGAVTGQPSVAPNGQGRTVTVNPAGGDYTVNVTPAPLTPFSCSGLSSPR